MPRDEFRSAVRNALALRAGYRCSFPACPQLTAGPGDESAMSYAIVGVAAHIHAAAPGKGARRYLSTMTPEERSHIDNGIWLCATHATLIDRDEVTYTAERLRQMKADHERATKEQVASGRADAGSRSLIAIGGDVVATGELAGTDGVTWNVRLHHFVRGDLAALIAWGESFEALPIDERFVLVNDLGDGRIMDTAPAWRAEAGAVHLSFRVQPRFPRIEAADIPEDIRVVDGDITVDFEMISGVAALPQKIQLCLWHQQGTEEWSLDRFGSRIAEYHTLFGESVWFEDLTKLEMIRFAAIPYANSTGAGAYTPFNCVERVRTVQLLAATPSNNWLPARVELEVKGLGSWTQNIKLFVPGWPPPRMTSPSAGEVPPP